MSEEIENMEKEPEEFIQEIIEKEEKKKPEKKSFFSRNKEKNERFYEIENNIVYEVQKLRTDLGIVSSWRDDEWKRIYVNNRDAGIAKRLMRTALEWERRFWGFGMRFVIIATLMTMVFFAVVAIWYNKFIKTNPPEIPQESIIETPVNVIPIVETDVQNNWTWETLTEDEKEFQDIEFERYKMKAEFEKESLLLELQKRDVEIVKINNILSEKDAEIKKKDTEIITKNTEIEQLKILVWEFKARDTTKDAFYIELWKKIDDECRKNGSDACKDLYYNFIQSN